MVTKIDRRGGVLNGAIDAVVSFCESPRPQSGIYLHGPVGCGKTLIAGKALLLMAQALAAENKNIGWAYLNAPRPPNAEIVTVPDLLAQIRATFNENGVSARSIVDDHRLKWFLVLDDIGAESPTEWVRDTLFQIIDWRYGYNLPTIFTSNCSLSVLAQRLGERIADRILEMCRDRIVEIKCGSYRDKVVPDGR